MIYKKTLQDRHLFLLFN